MATQMTYEIPDDKLQTIGDMLPYANMSTQEILSNAMQLLEWAVEQSKAGRDIVAINGNSGAYSPVSIPLLEKAKG